MAKIRCGFVTNSSSSSYIIGKRQDESVTVESVYKLVRDLYKKTYDNLDLLINFINDHPNLCLEYRKSKYGNYYAFKFTDSGKFRPEAKKKIYERLFNKFGISIHGWYDEIPTWLNCETYEEYKKYWLHEIESNKDKYVYAPFTIVDFLEEQPIYWLHRRSSEAHKVNSQADVLNWYYNYAEEIFSGDSCSNCEGNHKSWCNKDECDIERRKIKENNVPEKKACLYLLGRVCVYSESGYMPDFVVEELARTSEYFCHHMG